MKLFNSLIFSMVASALLATVNAPTQFVIAQTNITNRCSQYQPEEASRLVKDVFIKDIGVTITIPDNYRVVKTNNRNIVIVDNGYYNFMRCFYSGKSFSFVSDGSYSTRMTFSRYTPKREHEGFYSPGYDRTPGVMIVDNNKILLVFKTSTGYWSVVDDDEMARIEQPTNDGLFKENDQDQYYLNTFRQQMFEMNIRIHP